MRTRFRYSWSMRTTPRSLPPVDTRSRNRLSKRNAMSEEEVIKRRLLIDGDGTGDDRRLNVLLKTLIKWCDASDESPDQSNAVYEKMLSQLAQCEFAVAKSQLSSQMMAEELANYEKLSHTIEKEIEVAKMHIENSKKELKHAKTIRKNRIEYDVLAKVINEQPDRKQTEEKLTKLKKELTSLEESKRQADDKLNRRKKQFHVLVNSIRQLQAHLDETDSDDIMSISLDDVDEQNKSDAMEIMDIT